MNGSMDNEGCRVVKLTAGFPTFNNLSAIVIDQ
jgi:hypothetical protein